MLMRTSRKRLIARARWLGASEATFSPRLPRPNVISSSPFCVHQISETTFRREKRSEKLPEPGCQRAQSVQLNTSTGLARMAS
eukprot:4411306-Prymnesium_polylepis.1